MNVIYLNQVNINNFVRKFPAFKRLSRQKAIFNNCLRTSLEKYEECTSVFSHKQLINFSKIFVTKYSFLLKIIENKWLKYESVAL